MPRRIVALALVTLEELELLGPQFARAFPIEETPCFGELLAAIDEADRVVWRERDATEQRATQGSNFDEGTICVQPSLSAHR